MALDIKKLAKAVAAVANAAAVTLAALQSTGALTALSPKADAVVLGLVAALNFIVHAIPSNLLDAPK